uniref:L-threonine 3-dehydrogenase, mitochondrial n=1 Tax=Hirondellea gigas TaxID=1518452 RepID=A0A6A7GBG0_9CRUS
MFSAFRRKIALASPIVSGSRSRRLFSTQLHNIANPPRILVTGAVGQIGSELVPFLRKRYGVNNVIASDVSEIHSSSAEGPYVQADIMKFDKLDEVIQKHDINFVIHLACVLSAIGEQIPVLALKVNTRGIENILELARINKLRVYAPSSIAIYGPTTPKDETPQECVARPTTIYGITKVYTELIGEYYHQRFGVDFRSLRYPGIISSEAQPGGGTTDYAVEIYHEAIANKKYTCFLKEDTKMPMMYMPDTLRGTIQLIEAPEETLTQRSYNLTGMSFTPAEMAKEIQKEIPEFQIDYSPDFRQAIAESWPRSIDDSVARRDWNWKPEFNLSSMTKHIISRLREKKNLPST